MAIEFVSNGLKFFVNVTPVVASSVIVTDLDVVDPEPLWLLEQAAACPPPSEVFDADDPRFVEPGDVPERIVAWYRERGLSAPTSRPDITRAIVESLAAGFARGVEQSATLTGVRVKTDQCAGQSFIRSYATLTSSTDNTDDVITYLGVTKSV